jgi:peptide/nickel transport system substrate-binding protein
VPVLAANPDITIARADPLENTIMVRFNHLLPPFDNVKMRQAVLAVADQADFLAALAGDQKNWDLCPSFFTCGTPMANDAGTAALSGKRDFDKAKRLIAEAGYKGEKIVVMDAVDQPVPHTQALVVGELLKKLGLNVEVQAMDWGTLVTRRASMEPIDKGGWNIFFTWFIGPDLANPALSIPVRANGEKAWFGWPSDEKLETLRAQWFAAPDPDAQKRLAGEVQEEAFKDVPYIPTGQFVIPTAYRKGLKGVTVAPVVFLWNVEKQ